MNRLLAFVTIFILAVFSATAAEKPSLPHYPGQPKINVALKQLTDAQEKIATNAKEAGEHLQKATDSLEGAIKDKGSFRATAIRTTNQAIKYLEKGETEKAVHEIEEAIKATKKAGESGAR